jgi:hypothetical protein
VKREIFSMMIALLLVGVSPAHGQNSKINWWTFDVGYAASMLSNSMTRSVVGQGLLGTTKTGNTMVTGGFLADTLFRSFVVSVRDGEEVPTVFELSQNYPNPFNPSTTIHYEVPGLGVVQLVVYDILGREVAMLVNEMKGAGRYDINFTTTGLASGVYFYRMQAGDFVSTKKMMLLK